MPSVPYALRKTHGFADAGFNAQARVLDFIVRLGVDSVMGTATDDIQLATLPAGATILSADIEQVVAGTGTGTLAVRSGTTSLSGTLLATAAVGTRAGATPAALPRAVPASGEELNLIGATAVRNDGVIRVVVVYIEGNRSPNRPLLASRDATTGLA